MYACCRVWALCVEAQRLQLVGPGARAQRLQLVGPGARAQRLWRLDLVAPSHVESSCTRDRTGRSCIGRRMLTHRTTGKVQACSFRQHKADSKTKPILLQLAFPPALSVSSVTSARNLTVILHLTLSLIPSIWRQYYKMVKSLVCVEPNRPGIESWL